MMKYSLSFTKKTKKTQDKNKVDTKDATICSQYHTWKLSESYSFLIWLSKSLKHGGFSAILPKICWAGS